MCQKTRRYTSELSNKQWKRLAWIFAKRKGPGRPMELDVRAVVNAILYVVVTGCQWRNLPKEMPNPKSVFYHYRKWSLNGTWQQLNRALGWLERRRVGRTPRASAGVMDSQSVKTAGRAQARGYDGHKRVLGHKRHVLVDTLGNLLEVVVTAANRPDAQGAYALLSKVERLIALRLLKLWADSAYAGQLVDWLAQQWDIQLEIVGALATQQGFVVQPRRWVVERTFAWLGHSRRLSKDYEQTLSSSEAMIYVASIHTLLKRIA